MTEMITQRILRSCNSVVTDSDSFLRQRCNFETVFHFCNNDASMNELLLKNG